jgi:iron complex outermembrane receptor protein
LPNAPRHLAKLNVSIPFPDWRAGVEAQYTGPRRTKAPGVDVSGVTIVNLTLLSERIVRHGELSFSLYNLFDRKYDDPGRVEDVQDTNPQPGRTFRFKFSYTF